MKRIAICIFTLWFGSLSLWAAEVDFLKQKVVKLGEPVPDFSLHDTEDIINKLSDYRGKVVMIHFWSAKCPFVLRYDDRLKDITKDYKEQGVVSLAIDSNTNETLLDIEKVAKARKVNYPVLLDPGNKIADQFGAVTTPHVFIVDRDGKLAYEGAVDDQGWSEDKKPTESYVRNALDQILKGEPVKTPQTKSVGCTVKRF